MDGHAVYDPLVTFGEEYAYFRCAAECERELVARWRLKAVPNVVLPSAPSYPSRGWPTGWWRPPAEVLPGYYANSSSPSVHRSMAIGTDGTWYFTSTSYAMER